MSPLLCRERGRGVANGAHDVLIAGAAAHVAFETVADFRVAKASGFVRRSSCAAMIMPGVQKPHCRPCLFQKPFLQRMQRAGGREPFDRRDGAAIGLDREACARPDGDAVEEHGARAALTGVASDLGAGRAAEVADEVHKQQTRLDLAVVPAPIDDDADGDVHAGTSNVTGARIIHRAVVAAFYADLIKFRRAI